MESQGLEEKPTSGLSASEHAKHVEEQALTEERKKRQEQVLDQTEHADALKEAQQRIRSLVRSESEAQFQNRSLSAKFASITKKYEEVEQQRKLLERTLSKAQTDSDKLRFELQSHQQKLKVLQERTQSQDDTREKLAHKNRDLESKLSRTNSKLELFRGKIESLQRQLVDRDTETALVQQKLELVLREQDRLKEELSTLREEQKAGRQNKAVNDEKLLEAQKKISEIQEKLDRQLRQNNDLRQDREGSRNQILELEQLKAEQEKQIEELLEQLQVVMEHHAHEVEGLQSELEVSESARLNLQSAHRELTNVSEQDSEAFQFLSAERDALKDQSDALREQCRQLNVDLGLKQKQLTELTRWAERVRPAYETLKEKFSLLQAEFRSVHHRLGETEAKYQQQGRFVESLQVRETEKEEEIEGLTKEVAFLSTKLKEVLADCELKQQTTEELSQQLEELNIESEALRRKLSYSQESAENTETELSEMGDMLEEATSKRLEMQVLLTNLKSELKERIHRSDLLKNQLKESRTEQERLTEELDDIQHQADKAQSNLKELLRQRSHLLESKKATEDQLLEAQAQILDLEQRVNESRHAKEGLSVALDGLQLEFEEAGQEWNRRARSFEEQLDAKDALLKQRDEELAEEENVRRSRERTIAELQESILLLEEQQQNHLNQLEELNEVLELSQERAADLESKLAAEREDFEKVFAEKEQAHLDNKELEARIEDGHVRIEGLQSELKSRKSEIAGLEDERRALLQSLDESNAKSETLKEVLARSQREALGLREYIDKLQTLSKERLEQAKEALEKRDSTIKSHLQTIHQTKVEYQKLHRRLERSQLAEAALRGALTDLRLQIMEKDEMVEELEWHLGLVYQALEDGQVDLENRETELSEVSSNLASTEKTLQSTREKLQNTKDERERLQSELSELEQKFHQQSERIQEQVEEMDFLRQEASRTKQRLKRAMEDLSEEQERSANLGAQLTDALEDRNKRVQRLRALQQEFTDWRLSNGESKPEESPAFHEEMDELRTELVQSQAKESELQKDLLEARAKEDKLHDELGEARQRLAELATQLEQRPSQISDPQNNDFLLGEVSTGIELGAQVLNAQFDLMRVEQQHENLKAQSMKVETKDDLARVLEEMRSCEEEREHLGELFQALEQEWEQYKTSISEDGQQLLDSLLQIVDEEMRQTVRAEERVQELQRLLDEGGLPAAVPDQSELETELERLRTQLKERSQTADDLERELVALSAQLDELAQDDSWNETKTLRAQLKEKTELLEQYRQERQERPPGLESLEEELANLKGRYEQGRARICSLVSELEAKDRRLRELSESTPEPEPRLQLSPELHGDQFELPLTTMGEVLPETEDFSIKIEGFDLESDSAVDFREDTIEDLPAIPYPEDTTSVLLESTLPSFRDDSPDEAPGS